MPFEFKIDQLAADRIKNLAAKGNRPAEMLIDVKASGCSGFSYIFDWADNIQPECLCYTDHNVKVYITLEARPILNGATLTVSTIDLTEKFEIVNPNIKNTCGCGASFQV